MHLKDNSSGQISHLLVAYWIVNSFNDIMQFFNKFLNLAAILDLANLAHLGFAGTFGIIFLLVLPRCLPKFSSPWIFSNQKSLDKWTNIHTYNKYVTLLHNGGLIDWRCNDTIIGSIIFWLCTLNTQWYNTLLS